MSATTRRQLVGTVVVVVLAALVWYLQGGSAADQPDQPGDVPTVAASELPPEAIDTLELIDAGGPFPYPGDDGKVFGNREQLLPDEDAGYYREYTVPDARLGRPGRATDRDRGRRPGPDRVLLDRRPLPIVREDRQMSGLR